MSETKELILICANDTKGMLDVVESATLADARKQIYEELDDDLIIPDFAFHVNGIRVSVKQETRKIAWDYIGNHKVVAMRSKNGKRKLQEVSNVQPGPK